MHHAMTDKQLVALMRDGLSKLVEIRSIVSYDVWVRPSYGANLYNAGAHVTLADGSKQNVTIRTLSSVVRGSGAGKSAAVYVRSAIERSFN